MLKLCLIGLFSLSRIFSEAKEAKHDLDYEDDCSFHYWRVDWHTAVKICNRENKHLLCYKSKKEIDDLTNVFKDRGVEYYAQLEVWLSSRNCTNQNEQKECLSLHVQEKPKSSWHFFQTDCRNRFPFICCINEGETLTSISTSSTLETSTYTNNVISSTMTVQTSTPYPQCKSLRWRGIFWPDTNIGDVAVLPCPGNSTGEALWSCTKQNGGQWKKKGPDLRSCRSAEVKNIKDKFNTSTVAETVSLINDVVQDPDKEIFSEDLADIVFMMNLLPERLSTELDVDSEANRWVSTKDIVEKSASVIDRIIELPSTWNDISQKRRPSIGTNLLSTVDGFGALLADSMVENIDEQSIIGKNMALQVIRSKYGESMELPQWTVTSHYSKRGNIILDQGYDRSVDLNVGNVSVIFTLYSNLSNILQHDESKTDEISSSCLNSAVVSATVTQAKQTISISNKVRILVEHLVPNPNRTACVFWNVIKNQWDTTGCKLEVGNETFSLCVCDHLTNFAVLMDYRGVLDDVDQRPFFYITVIGCTLSIFCLAICIIVFSCYSFHSKHSWGLRYVIHRNLCLTLLVGNLVLVFGLDKTENERLCTVIAGMLHYFFLSAFSWMLLEGVHIYMLLVVVFASRRSHWEKYYLFGYGFPLVIVAITAFSRPMYYGTEDICWLSTEKGTIWAFMGPVACILIVNVAALLLAQYKASNISVKDDNVALAKRWLRITFILFPVLGITWLFGFFNIGQKFVVMAYIFAVLNSLQGFCIFVCHCLLDKKARNMVLASFKKKSSTIHTGSTGMPKKQNDPKENAKKVSNLEQNGLPNKLDDLNQVQILSSRDRWKKWYRWHVPWSFCFDMPVTEPSSNNCQKHDDSTPKPIALQWNNLKELA